MRRSVMRESDSPCARVDRRRAEGSDDYCSGVSALVGLRRLKPEQAEGF